MARTLNRLTDRKVRTAGPGMHADGGGLWLQVTATKQARRKGDDRKLNRSWLFRFATGEVIAVKNGKRRQRERLMGLGSAEDTTLAEARQKAAECRKMREQGIDPIQARNTQRAAQIGAAAKVVTFDECRDAYIKAHRDGWRNPKHAAQWGSTLATYASPVLGKLPVATVDTPLVLKVIESIWATKAETANRVRGRIESILDWAKARGYRHGDNPARWKGHLDHLLPARSKVSKVKHHAALPYTRIGKFMIDLRKLTSVSALALEFTILTAARTGEVIGARWTEIDLQKRIWTVPGDRMKSGREHRVPLSARALQILKKMKNEGESDYVFPGALKGKPLSNMALLQLLRGMKATDGLTVHGFRSSFRDWAAEQTSTPNFVVEMALAHAVGDAVEAAYRRGDLLERRRELMKAWAEYCNVEAAK